MGGDESWVGKTFNAGAFGVAVGSVIGAGQVAWKQQAAAVSREAPIVTLGGALKLVRFNAGVFACVGVAYVTAETALAAFLGPRPVQQGIVGGVAAGTTLGLAANNFKFGFNSSLLLGAVMGIAAYNNNQLASRSEKNWSRVLPQEASSE